jgi:2,4-dienoyl-CoA reductase [(3E)-enoyl-CoA-producing], peroxisomal
MVVYNAFTSCWLTLNSAGAAGNFLASIEQLSVNAFKSVMDIDVLGSYNTLKATLPYLIESGKKHRVDSERKSSSGNYCTALF